MNDDNGFYSHSLTARYAHWYIGQQQLAVSVTVCFLFTMRTGLLALYQTPNLEDERITFYLAPTHRAVRHGWPYEEYMTPAGDKVVIP